ncbi:hypothetical protein V493_01597 [Pseudogymnoascus sp. VKM F-4281 (FW-2241)]|nr:hypothetical protein V493_01597 [Pseudogymnoascus sp. VKM F-4281 (FW-2241)]
MEATRHGLVDAWKPANLTTDRGGAPGRTRKPLSQNFRCHYSSLPTTQVSAADDADMPQTQVEPVIFTRQDHGCASSTTLTTLTSFLIQPCQPIFQGKKAKMQRGLPGHRFAQAFPYACFSPKSPSSAGPEAPYRYEVLVLFCNSSTVDEASGAASEAVGRVGRALIAGADATADVSRGAGSANERKET